MKKILSLVLALLMSASAASMIAAADEAAIAEDTAVVEEAAPSQYEDAIKLLNYYGIYKGTSTVEFDADAESEIQRYQMALFVARISTGWVDDSNWAVYGEWNDGIENRSVFDDLGGTYAEKVFGAISYANQKGIIEGYGNGKFGPTDGITYQNALTMVVRTLGYQNLAWPWGYIEKGVQLGLTKGVATDVAYTDVLTRGEVAQIIYNALFATTKDGDTLAARNFNGGLGWETIVITAAGWGRLLGDDTKVDPNSTYSNLNNKIAFKTVNPDGTLSDATYFVKNDESFKYPEHKELKLGYAYKALFTMDKDSEFVKLIAYKDNSNDSTLQGTKWNFGLPTKDAETGKYPIQTFLNGYSLVSKYSKNTYLGNQKDLYGIAGGFTEMIVRNGLQGQKVTVTTDVRKYGVDWYTGNIIENTGKKDANGDYIFETAWYFNALLRQYFEYKYERDVDGNYKVVGINILDEEEIKKMVGDQFLTEEKEFKTGLPVLDKIGTTAYASLKYFTILDANKPNYGIYESYRLGLYGEKSDIKCSNGNHEKEGFVVYGLDSIAKQTWKQYKDGKFNAKPTLSGQVGYAPYAYDKAVWQGADSDHPFGAWISEEEGCLTPEVGDYIIYNYDQGTGELKVVKNITKQNDKDNFVTTGVVRAYNVAAKTVTIGDTKYSFDYIELAGNGLKLDDSDNKLQERAKFTDLFRGLFNQYVTYVVCDGKLVYIEACDASAELIVVDSYAGLSSDGYIVVNGYKTDDLIYSQFRIGSYNGWVKGDYYYYLTRQAVESSFTRGSLYRITSYQADADVYYVYTIEKSIERSLGADPDHLPADPKLAPVVSDFAYMDYDIDELVELGVVEKDPYTVEISNGYKIIRGYDPDLTKTEKAKKDNRYVLICNPIDNKFGGHDYAPIIVYTGTGADGWYVKGYKVKDTSATVLIGVDFNEVIGFNRDQYDFTFVLFLGYDYESASYNGADTENDWYLLGASEYSVRVFDIYRGEVVTKVATNKDLRKGYAYPSINGVVVNDSRYDALDLNTDVTAAYRSGKIFKFLWNTIDPMTGKLNYPALKDSYLGDKGKEAFSKDILSDWLKKTVTLSNGTVIKIDDLTSGGLKFFLVAEEDEKDISKNRITTLMGVNKDQLRDWAIENKLYKVDTDGNALDEKGKVTTDKSKYVLDFSRVEYWFIYDVENKSTVVYINYNAVKPIVTSKATFNTDNLVDVSGTTPITGAPNEAYISASFEGTETIDKQTNLRTEITLNKVGFEFVGPAITVDPKNVEGDGDTHYAINYNDYHFGLYGDCTAEYWEVVENENRVYNSIDVIRYQPHVEDTELCNLIRGVAFPIAPVTLKAGDPAVQLTFTFVDSGDANDPKGNVAQTKYEFTIEVELKADGTLRIEFVTGTAITAGTNSAIAASSTFVARADAKDAAATIFAK